jgi:hypothetical protein
MSKNRLILAAGLLAASSLLAQTAPAPAPAAAPQPSSPAKKELVARLMSLYQPDLDRLAVSLAERPALQLMQQAGARLQAVPQDRREALARDIEADVRKYAEEAAPIVRASAGRIGPQTVAPMIEERFTEDELRQVLAMFDALRTPGARKFQQMQPEIQRALGERLVAETKDQVEVKVRAMEQAVNNRLGTEGGNTGAAPAPAPRPPAPAQRPASAPRR